MRHYLLWFLVFLSVGIGCGRKAPPLSPEAALPVLIEGLQGGVRPEGILLFWKTPSGFSSFSYRVFRRKETVEGEWRPVGEISRFSGGARNIFWDKAVEKGHRYRYGVRGLNAQERWMATSNEVVFSWEDPIAAPQKVSVRRLDRGVEIFWSPLQLEGIEIVGYVVYRQREGREVPLFPVALAPMVAPPFVDFGISEVGRYRYQVAAVRRFGNTLMQGKVSEAVVIDVP